MDMKILFVGALDMEIRAQKGKMSAAYLFSS